jgi:toxin CptA
MLWLLVLFAPFSLLASGLPRGLAWPAAVGVAAWAARDVRRYHALRVRRLIIPAGRGTATCDGEPVEALTLNWRGPLAFLQWQDRAGCRHRAAFWPDTLGPGMRRELQIALQRRDAAPKTASMAG